MTADGTPGGVLAYHPGTQATVVVPPDAMNHYRMSGWLLKSEWDEQQAQLAERAAQAAQAAAKPSAKAGDSSKEK